MHVYNINLMIYKHCHPADCGAQRISLVDIIDYLLRQSGVNVLSLSLYMCAQIK